MEQLLSVPCFRQCGLVPWRGDLFADVAVPAPTEQWQASAVDLTTLTAQQRHDEQWEADRLVVYTDGSARNLAYPTLARAGWGVFVGEGHPCTQRGRVETVSQTSYRAEVRALAQALDVTTAPVLLVSDCATAVRQLQQILDDHAAGQPSPLPSEEQAFWSISRPVCRGALKGSARSAGPRGTSQAKQLNVR